MFEQQNQVKISILVPIYNSESFLVECLDSLCNQTLKDIEIICVNDGSSDNSLAILNAYKEKDHRIKVISYENNQGLMRARYHAIKEAIGKYTLFVDSDDSLVLNACEIAYNAIEKYNVDILHFSAKVVPYGLVNQRDVIDVKPYVSSYLKRLKGKNIYKNCFKNHRFGWNVWNKIYKTELVKKIEQYIPNNHCTLGEDMFLFTMLSYFANTYAGIKDELYNYRYGSGVSTTGFSKRQFKSFANKITAIKNTKDFLEKVNSYDGFYKDFIDNELEEYYNVLTWHFMKSVTEKEAPECFDLMLQHVEVDEVINRLLNFNDIFTLARRLDGVKSFIPINKKIKNIALFYFNYGNGGVERVMSKLIPILHDLGYEVTLLIEKEVKTAFELPSFCKKIVLPSSEKLDINEYKEHAKKLKEVLINENIDLVLYHASNSPYMIYDLIVTKSLCKYFVSNTHDWITSPLIYNGKHFAWKPQVLKLCDSVQTITTLEEKVYKSYNINAKYIPNPLTFNVSDNKFDAVKEDCIVWVGRIDDLQKNPNDALLIMQEITKYLPNYKMYILGNGDKERNKLFENYIKSLNLSNNVEWIKHTKHPEDYYKKAKLLLMTSSYEVYPMVIGEAMSFGLPIVCYDMPYVEMLKVNKNGAIFVEPRNIKDASNKVIEVLLNEDLQKTMSKASLESINIINGFDLNSAWKNYLFDIENQKSFIDKEIDKDLFNFLDISYRHYFYDMSQYYEEISLIRNLFRYFKKFGIVSTFKKTIRYIKMHGLKAALRKGKYKLN